MNERQIKLLKVICPYINAHIQPHLLTFLSIMELRLNLSNITTPLNYPFIHKEPLITDKDMLLCELKKNTSKEEQDMIDKFLMLEQMMRLMEMMQEMQKSSDSEEGGSSGSNMGFEMLKSFLPQESVETFEFVKMMMENNDNGS